MSIVNQKQFPLILLVEDNIIALKLVEAIATQAGAHFISVTTGEDAFSLLKQRHFDLVITDLGLPGISGLELADLVRAFEKISNKKPTPMIGLTAKDLHDLEDSCLRAGLNKILSKPIYLKEMESLISTFCVADDPLKPFPRENKACSLSQYPLFSLDLGIKNMGDEQLLVDLLRLMVNRVIPEDIALMEKAYKGKNWNKIQEIAHKMKSGALYCGTIRMQHACHSFSDFQKNDAHGSLVELYNQLIEVLNDTKAHIKNWLQQQELR